MPLDQLHAERGVRASGLYPPDARCCQANGVPARPHHLRVHRGRETRCGPPAEHLADLQGDRLQDGHRRLRRGLCRTSAPREVPARHREDRHGSGARHRRQPGQTLHPASHAPPARRAGGRHLRARASRRSTSSRCFRISESASFRVTCSQSQPSRGWPHRPLPEEVFARRPHSSTIPGAGPPRVTRRTD